MSKEIIFVHDWSALGPTLFLESHICLLFEYSFPLFVCMIQLTNSNLVIFNEKNNSKTVTAIISSQKRVLSVIGPFFSASKKDWSYVPWEDVSPSCCLTKKHMNSGISFRLGQWMETSACMFLLKIIILPVANVCFSFMHMGRWEVVFMWPISAKRGEWWQMGFSCSSFSNKIYMMPSENEATFASS